MGRILTRWGSLAGRAASLAPGRSASFLALAVILLAGLIRIMRSAGGLPYLHEWDEPPTASRALRMMQTGDFNPHFFHYGSLMTYLNLLVDIAHYFYLMARSEGAGPHLTSLDDIKTFFDTGWLWTISHPSFYLWNRWLTAAMGTASVWITFALAKRAAGRWAGLLAAALLAGLEFHVAQSSLVLPNVPVSFFVLLATWLSVLYAQEGGPGRLLGALAACGAAISIKYNAGLCLLVPVLALVSSPKGPEPRRRGWLWAAAVLVPPVVFLLGTPYALLDMPSFLKGVGYQVREYNVLGHGPATIEPGLGHLALQAGRIASNLGLAGAGLALVGLARLLGTAAGRILLAFPVAYALFMTGTRVSFHRNFTAIYPFAAVAAGCGAVLLHRLLVEAARRHGVPGRPAAAAAALLLAAPGAASVARGCVGAWEAWTTLETRSQAVLWINALQSEGAGFASVGIAEELRIHADDLGRLAIPHETAPLLYLLCAGSGRHDLIVTAARYDVGEKQNLSDAATLNDLIARAARPLDAIEGERAALLDRISRNPGIALFRRRPGSGLPDLECGEEIPAGRFASGEGSVAQKDGTVAIQAGGAVSTPAFLTGPGSYALCLRARAGSPVSRGLRLKATVVGYLAGGRKRSGPEQVIQVGADLGQHVVRFDVTDASAAAVSLEFPDEPYLARLNRGQTIHLESVRLIRIPEPEGSRVAAAP